MPAMGHAHFSFDPTLVVLSVVIAFFGSVAGLQSARRARRRTGSVQLAWIVAAALSIGGGGIWSMHFIGMLAYSSTVRFSFDVGLTVLSLVVAVLASGVGLLVAGGGRQTVGRYLTAGVITGAGVAGMHYLGMAAMRMNADLSFRGIVVAASIVIAVVAASAALFFALNVERFWVTVSASLVMALGICGMHYTGMAAAVVTPHTTIPTDAVSGVDPLTLALPVFGITSVLLFVLLFAGLFSDVDDELAAAASSPLAA